MDIDKILEGAEEAQPQSEPEQQAPVEIDPLAHLIGQANPELDRDPFEAMLDNMLASEGLTTESETGSKTEGFEAHEWEFKSGLVYEGDQVEAICKKCFRQMRMDRHQTWNEAMDHHGVNRDCGLGIMAEVTDS